MLDADDMDAVEPGSGTPYEEGWGAGWHDWGYTKCNHLKDARAMVYWERGFTEGQACRARYHVVRQEMLRRVAREEMVYRGELLMKDMPAGQYRGREGRRRMGR